MIITIDMIITIIIIMWALPRSGLASSLSAAAAAAASFHVAGAGPYMCIMCIIYIYIHIYTYIHILLLLLLIIIIIIITLSIMNNDNVVSMSQECREFKKGGFSTRGFSNQACFQCLHVESGSQCITIAQGKRTHC